MPLVIKLRLIGPSADQENLVFSSQKKGRRGSHLVAVDDKLFRVLEELVRKRRQKERAERGETARPRREEPKLAPREIQRLLRSGRSVDQVAKMAGVDVAWVERFFGPILDERAVAIQDCQGARLEKQRLGVSGAPLGEAVGRNLKARRVKISDAELDQAWDAWRVDGQPWVITLTFPFRGREQRATWRYDPFTREVTAANRLGSDLGWVADGRRAPAAPRERAAKPAPPKARASRAKLGRTRSGAKPKRSAPSAPAAKRTARKASATRKQAAKRRTTTKRRAAPKRRAAAARRPAGRRPAAKRPAARRSSGPARRKPVRRPARKPVARRSAAKRPATRRPATRRAARRPATRRRSRR